MMCAVEGCERAAAKAGLCSPHYNRKRRTGKTGEATIGATFYHRGHQPEYPQGAPRPTPGPAAAPEPTPLPGARDNRCTVPGCENEQQKGGGGYCAGHYKRARQNGGDPLAHIPLRRYRYAAVAEQTCRACGGPIRPTGVGPRGGDLSLNRGAHGLCPSCTKKARHERRKLERAQTVRRYRF